MNYTFINGLIILDDYYTSIEFIESSSYSIIKNPNNRKITVNFTSGMMSSQINDYELVNDIPLQDGFSLLNLKYIEINDNIFYFKSAIDYISQYITNFLDNDVIIKDNHLMINIREDITLDDYKILLQDHVIVIGNGNHLFNSTLLHINKIQLNILDNNVYSKKEDVYVSSIDLRNSFIDAVTDLSGIQVITSIDQRHIKDNEYKEYFQISNGLAKSSDNLNTRVIYDPDCERLKNTKIDFKLNYFTKDISLYERRYHEFLLKNDLNRLTTFTVRDNWTASVDWSYNRLSTDLSYDEIKLDDNSNSTMMYSISFEVSVLFFIIERNSLYPRILEYMIDIDTVRPEK